MRSINTSLIALLPVSGLLFVGALLLGAGTLKDLALALFVGLASGAYSSLFLATPLLADLKEREPQLQGAAPAGQRPPHRAAGPAPGRLAALGGACDRRCRRRRRPVGTDAAPLSGHPERRRRPAGQQAGAEEGPTPRRRASAQALNLRRGPPGARSATSPTSRSQASSSRTSRRCSPTTAAFAAAVDQIVAAHARGTVDKVVGVEARGFLLAAPVAYLLGAGVVPVRKPGKLPGPVHERAYDLEYGTNTLRGAPGRLRAGDRVLVVDDVLATGGTAAAAVHLVQHCWRDRRRRGRPAGAGVPRRSGGAARGRRTRSAHCLIGKA